MRLALEAVVLLLTGAADLSWEEVRKVVDAVEGLVPPDMWTLATYKELLFLDCNQGATC